MWGKTKESYKDYDFYIATWNVLSLHRAGMLKRKWKYIELVLRNSRDEMEGKCLMQGISY